MWVAHAIWSIAVLVVSVYIKMLSVMYFLCVVGVDKNINMIYQIKMFLTLLLSTNFSRNAFEVRIINIHNLAAKPLSCFGDGNWLATITKR